MQSIHVSPPEIAINSVCTEMCKVPKYLSKFSTPSPELSMMWLFATSVKRMPKTYLSLKSYRLRSSEVHNHGQQQHRPEERLQSVHDREDQGAQGAEEPYHTSVWRLSLRAQDGARITRKIRVRRVMRRMRKIRRLLLEPAMRGSWATNSAVHLRGAYGHVKAPRSSMRAERTMERSKRFQAQPACSQTR